MPGFIERLRHPPLVVPVLRLTGVIGHHTGLRQSLTLGALAGAIERAFHSPRTKAVALAVNSPGGSAVQSALIAGRIRQLAEEKNKPVYAFVEDVAASGGYWLACAADEIYADPSSIVGSIGVVSAGFGFDDFIQRYGVERRVHTSGRRKMILDPFQPERPDDVQKLKSIQHDIHQVFKAQVRARRGNRLKGSEDELFEGEFWTGDKALELGLVDGLLHQLGGSGQRAADELRLGQLRQGLAGGRVLRMAAR